MIGKRRRRMRMRRDKEEYDTKNILYHHCGFII
jgi:hypothetical protein